MCIRIRKRSAIVHGQKTSLSLEDRFWFGLKAIADDRAMTLRALLEEIDIWRQSKPNESRNLSSACRCYVLDYLSEQMAKAA